MQIHRKPPIPPKGGQQSKNATLLNQMNTGDAVDMDRKSLVNSFRNSARRLGCRIKTRTIMHNGATIIRCWKLEK